MPRISLSASNLVVANRKVHYAWVIVAVASVMWVTSSSIRFAISLLVPELQDSSGPFGWSYFYIALAFTLQWTLSGVLSPIAGWLGDRYGVRKIMVVGAALFIAGMLLTGVMTSLWQFLLYFGVVLGASMAIFQVSLITGVTLWFRRHLGLAIGLLQGFQGLGTVLAIVMVFLLFTSLGWRWTFWIPGLAGGAVLLLLTRFFHNEPADLGLRRLGEDEAQPIRYLQNNDLSKIRTKAFLEHAQKTSAFWNLVGIHFWGCAGHNVILIFLVAMAVDRGVSQGMAAGIYATMTAASTITRFAVPVVSDRIGSKIAMAACFSLQTVPVLLLLVAQDAWVFYVFAVLFGIGLGGEMSAFPIINRQYYGDAPSGTTYGWQTLGGGIGMALGPLLGGLIWTQTGSYTGAVLLSFFLSLVGVISIIALPGTSHHLIPQWEESLPPEARSTA
jgi:MFS family permease